MKKMYIQYSLPVSVIRENKRFVAYTPALDLSTSGKSYAEAQRRFLEISSIFLEELFQKGTASEVLGELGWRKTKKQWQPPVVVSQQSEIISVPA